MADARNVCNSTAPNLSAWKQGNRVSRVLSAGIRLWQCDSKTEKYSFLQPSQLTITPTVCWKQPKVTGSLVQLLQKNHFQYHGFGTSCDKLCFAIFRAVWGLTGITHSTPATSLFTVCPWPTLLIHTTSAGKVHHYQTTLFFTI